HVMGLLTLLVVIVFMPLLVRLILGLERLPDGPVRRRLETVARRLGFRCTDLLVWNTRGGMANAMVLGLLPWPRYVVFTDRLLDDFTTDEVEAVLGHEAGHVKHHHMLFYLGFLTLSMAILFLLSQLLIDPESKTHRDYLDALPWAAALIAYIFVVFGFVSRRCERQADVYGCRAVSCSSPNCVEH